MEPPGCHALSDLSVPSTAAGVSTRPEPMMLCEASDSRGVKRLELVPRLNPGSERGPGATGRQEPRSCRTGRLADGARASANAELPAR
jgi:hypothetical protein